MDLQGGHLVMQIVKCHGHLQGPPVLIDDGMTGESWQEWHGNIWVHNLDRFWALPLCLANKDLQGDHLVIQLVKRHGNLQKTPRCLLPMA